MAKFETRNKDEWRIANGIRLPSLVPRPASHVPDSRLLIRDL